MPNKDKMMNSYSSASIVASQCCTPAFQFYVTLLLFINFEYLFCNRKNSTPVTKIKIKPIHEKYKSPIEAKVKSPVKTKQTNNIKFCTKHGIIENAVLLMVSSDFWVDKNLSYISQVIKT